MRQSGYTIGTQQKNIRALAGDLFQNINIKVAKTAVNASLKNGILPAGTIVNNKGIPANDNTAYGVVYNDVDFNNTKGTEILSVCIFGFLNEAKITEYSGTAPSEAAKTALNMIKFL